ncbi:MAG: entericidin A/B family lipoprotein [Chthoniobacterales bacterium]
MKQLLLIGAAALSLATLAGCNTIRGVGEDISALGRALSDSTGRSSNETEH